MYSASISAATKFVLTSTQTNSGRKSSAPNAIDDLPACVVLTELKMVAMAASRFSSFSSGESAACSRDRYWDIVCRAASDGGVIFD